jgi:hypothetical protein
MSDEDSARGGFKDGEQILTTAKRVIDEEAGVVLYGVKSEMAGYGLAAVPIEDTTLSLDEDDEATD